MEQHGGLFSMPHDMDNVIDFSSNVIPGGPPPKVAAALRSALADAEKYPDPESKKMKKCLALYMRVPTNTIAVGNGATDIIYRFCSYVLSKNTHVCVTNPTFSEYESASSLAGHRVTKFTGINIGRDLEKFSKAMPKNGCVFVCNPNNPTGELLEIKDILYLADMAKSKSSILFVDESFIELVPGKNRSVVTFAPKRKNLFVLRSLTKSFAIPGIRVGYCVTNKNMADIVNCTSMPWNVSVLAQRATCAAVSSHKKHLAWARQLIKTESEFLQKNINKIDGYKCVQNPSSNFILVHSKLNSHVIWKKLLRHKILVRDCTSFGNVCCNHIRIAIKTRTENKKLLEALKSI
ncbi:MAG: aminotransferase [Cenarchaeum symbiont of Oopsacas minuta]|nr:aminotransferase [Cenarchaeum symbiont of Oopsacas minuta]